MCDFGYPVPKFKMAAVFLLLIFLSLSEKATRRPKDAIIIIIIICSENYRTTLFSLLADFPTIIDWPFQQRRCYPLPENESVAAIKIIINIIFILIVVIIIAILIFSSSRLGPEPSGQLTNHFAF